MKRIIIHWTAGRHKPNTVDRAAYHWLIEGDGTVTNGMLSPEANLSTDDDNYAAHTLNLNTGSIGIAVCAMHEAEESPFDWGRAPITPAQLASLARHTASVARRYGIAISKRTVLTHAEVQPTLGVRQKAKWDITVLPGMDKPGDPIEVGDRIRDMIRKASKAQPAPDPEIPEGYKPVTILWPEGETA